MDIDAEVRSAMPAVMERIKAEAIKNIEQAAAHAATQVATDAARKWATEVLVPEIVAQLDSGKSGMVAAAQRAAEQMGQEITKALVGQVMKTLSSSHTTRNVAELLFRGY